MEIKLLLTFFNYGSLDKSLAEVILVGDFCL